MRLFLWVFAICVWGNHLVAQTTFIGSHVWTVDDPKFGGLSGLEMSDDGSKLIAVGDRGIVVEANLTRDDGQISSIEMKALWRIRSETGNRLTSGTTDSEGLAVGPDGTLYISFEGDETRIAQHQTVAAPAVVLPIPRDFWTMQPNSGPEALAVDQTGAIYTIPERSGRANRPFPIYRFQNNTWNIPATLPRTGTFLVVGADFGPDGLLYILERDFAGFGFRNRVRTMNMTDGTVETILETRALVHGNLEGISLWVNTAGETIMTLIADDNFSRFQQTEVVEYRIDS